MTKISASAPEPTTFLDYQKMIDKVKADCGVMVAQEEVKKLEEREDTIDHLSTLALSA